MIIFTFITITYFITILTICIYLKYYPKQKIVHNPSYGFWFDFAILSAIPFLPLLAIINHFRKPKKTFNRILVTRDDFVECIKTFMGDKTEWHIEESIGSIKILIKRTGLFNNGFDKRFSMLKANVERNKPVYLRVEWSEWK